MSQLISLIQCVVFTALPFLAIVENILVEVRDYRWWIAIGLVLRVLVGKLLNWFDGGVVGVHECDVMEWREVKQGWLLISRLRTSRLLLKPYFCFRTYYSFAET